MMGWLFKKIAVSPTKSVEAPPALAPERCALWHDVTRALDAKPKSATK